MKQHNLRQDIKPLTYHTSPWYNTYRAVSAINQPSKLDQNLASYGLKYGRLSII